MFGKLMKYELRYLIRIFAPMWAAVFALCVMFRFSVIPHQINMSDSHFYVDGSEAVLSAVLAILVVFAIMTMMLIATVVLIQRFYKGMYGDEGYLMFTLPVTTGQLIHSKALSALLILVATELITMVGIFIMMAFKELWGEFPRLWSIFIQIMEQNGIGKGMLGVYIIWGVAAFLLVAAASIYMVYLAISVGQMWKKHPVAGGILAFYAITIVISIVEGSLGFNGQLMFMETVAYIEALNALLLYCTLRGLVLLGISFFGTKLILDKNLNIA